MEDNAHFYVVRDCIGYDMILGAKWLDKQDVVIESKWKQLLLRQVSQVRINVCCRYGRRGRKSDNGLKRLQPEQTRTSGLSAIAKL
ncbi:hypothetical protein N7535_002325 [Penicillium sp. DV-2018c]|nr:hypothetical protein N7535_002325 [Penicillium sp. DV-2018c]